MGSELNEIIERSGEEGIEVRMIELFTDYKEKAYTYTTSTKISQTQRIELAQAKQQYDAILKAKKDMLTKKQQTKMQETLMQDGGITTITYEIELCMDDLDQASRKQEEFPDDEQANIDLEVIEARLDSMCNAGDLIIEEKVIG